ncbi:MAG: 4a-hydroxytetrahydrobiopterin dehydratase [Vicinamibacterales bacterium]
MVTLNTEEVRERLRQLPGWVVENGAISRRFTFSGFADAVAFVVRLGFAAEAADHHPDLLISYKRVTATFITHSEGGLTGKDFDGARQADAVAGSLGATELL